MKKKITFAFVLLVMLTLTTGAMAQTARPGRTPRWDRTVDWILNGQETLTYKTISNCLGLTVGADGAGYDVYFYGETASNYVLYDASEDLLSVIQTNASTSGTERAATVSLTKTGAGGSADAFYAKVIADVQTGSHVCAIYSQVDYSTGSTGDAGGGIAMGLCSEINLPAKSPSGGAYYAVDLEIETPENFSSITNPTSFPMAYIRTGLWGNSTAKGNWQDYGYIFHFDNLDDATGNVWFDNTLRILVEETAFYIPLSTAQASYTSAYPISGTVITAATSFDPDASDGATLGTAALEFSDLYIADAGILYFGDDQEVTLTHVHDTGILLNAAMVFQFRDATEVINSSTDGQLDIDATTEVEITTATVDLNGALDVSSTITGADEVDITKSTEGMALDVNYTATAYTTLLGAVDIRRTGSLTGTDTETMVDLAIIPALTFTEPGGGETVNYYGAHIDMTSLEVAAGAGSSVIAALNLVADTDGDAGANWALRTSGAISVTAAPADGIAVSTTGADGIHVSGVNTSNAIHLDGNATTNMLLIDGTDPTRGIFMTGGFQDAIKIEGSTTTRRFFFAKQDLGTRHTDASDDNFWGMYLHMTHGISSANAHFIGVATYLNNDTGDKFQVLSQENSLVSSAIVNRIAGEVYEFTVTAQPDGGVGSWANTSKNYLGMLIYQNPSNSIEGDAAIAIDDDWTQTFWIDPGEMTQIFNFPSETGALSAHAADEASSGRIKILVDGDTRYIYYYD